MIKKYLNHKKDIALEFTKDELRINVTADQVDWDGLKHTISRHPEDLSTATWTAQKVLSIDKKIALFCTNYKEYVLKKTGKAVSYTPMKKDIAALKQIPVTPALIQAYFNCEEWWCKQKNMANYTHNINNIKLLLANAGTTKSKYPMDYDPVFERTLQPKELTGYWAHLRANGWKQQSRSGGKVWKKLS